MHCPRCGQQQASEYVKFCSRCGFLLELIPEILANGGVLPQLAELDKNTNQKLFTRRNGIKLSVLWTIVMWFLLTPLFGMIGADELAGLTAVLGFAGGLILMLISFFFLDSKPQFSNSQKASFKSDYTQQNLSGGAPQNALPPQQSVPASSYIPPQPGRWQTTNDLAAPSSVTEQTTKLLREDEK